MNQKHYSLPHIRHQLIIGASPEKIYEAITTQSGLSAWWTPDSIAAPEIHSIARFHFGPDYFKEMKIEELSPSHLVKWICIAGADEWKGTTISFELQPGDKIATLNSHPELKDQVQQQDGIKMTLLIFHHDNWKEYSAMFAECNYTWARFLRSLKLLCETGKGLPWPNQHGT